MNDDYLIKVDIRDIKPKGLDIEDQIPEDQMGLSRKDYLYFISPLKVKARLQRAEDSVLSKISVHGRYSSTCARSLETVERDWADQFVLNYSISPNTTCFDLGDEIRQEVILRLPIRVLSDKEIEKEKMDKSRIKEKDLSADVEQKDTYKPFANLKLNDDMT